MSTKPGRIAGFTRRMSRFPAIAEDWEARPYFLWDTDMSWRDFRDSLDGQGRAMRVWALERLLREAITVFTPEQALETLGIVTDDT